MAARRTSRAGALMPTPSEPDCVLLRSFAAGPVFALTADVPSVKRQTTPEEASLKSWMAGSTTGREAAVSYYPDPLHAGLGWAFRLPARQTVTCKCLWKLIVLLSQPRTSQNGIVDAMNSEKEGACQLFWSEDNLQ